MNFVLVFLLCVRENTLCVASPRAHMSRASDEVKQNMSFYVFHLGRARRGVGGLNCSFLVGPVPSWSAAAVAAAAATARPSGVSARNQI